MKKPQLKTNTTHIILREDDDTAQMYCVKQLSRLSRIKRLTRLSIKPNLGGTCGIQPLRWRYRVPNNNEANSQFENEIQLLMPNQSQTKMF